MKPCAYTKQTLLDHSIGSYEDLVNFKLFDDNYYRVVSRRLESVGISLSAKEVKELIKDLILLHDLGKAGEYYQDQFDDECNTLNNEQPSFLYHEIGSALFFYNDYNAKREIRELLALASLNHLNAIRGIWSYTQLMLPGFDERMLKLERYGNVLLEGLKDKLSSDAKIRNYSFDDFSIMIESLVKRNMKYKYHKVYILLLAPLLVGDNLNSLKRNSKGSRFVRLLLKGEYNEDTSL